MSLIPAEELLPRQPAWPRRRTAQMRVMWAAGVEPEFDDCYDDFLAKVARQRSIEPLPIYPDSSGDSKPPLYLVGPFTSARRRYAHEAVARGLWDELAAELGLTDAAA